MKISVIVPAFNAEPFLERAVTSLLATGHADLEVLIVEDGSTDGTLQTAQRLLQEHPEQVRLLRHPGGANRGVSATRNLGIAQAGGDAVCFLDADDYVLPHRFDRAVQILQSRSEVDGVYDSTAISVQDQAAGAGLGGSVDGAIFGLSIACEGEHLLRQLLRGYPWGSDAFLCRRSLFDRTGVFDETLRIAEDCHLWFRAAALGRIVPGELTRPVAVYVRHAANTFHYRIERKVDMIRAMARAWPSVRAGTAPSTASVYREGMTDYLVNTLIVCREAACPDVAWAAIRACVASPTTRVLCDTRVLRQIAWLTRETLMPRTFPSASPLRPMPHREH